MTITREQVADLQSGDVVELAHEAFPGVTMSGPLSDGGDGRLLLGVRLVREADGSPTWDAARQTLTVVSRAPRPLYVNHPRTEPVAGDVVIPVEHAPDDLATWSWCPLRSGVYRWRNTGDDSWLDREDLDVHLHLLVDGETGQVVP